MKLSQLIERLQDLQSQCETDPEVLLAQQPRWAMEYQVGAVNLVVANQDEIDRDKAEQEEDPGEAVETIPDPVHVVYIGEGRYIGYLTGPSDAVWDQT